MPIPGSRLSTALTLDPASTAFPDSCTVQALNNTIDGTGGVVPGIPTDVTGMVAIPCRLVPIILMRPTDTEVRVQDITRYYENRHLVLFGYFPGIVPGDHQVVISGGDPLTTETFQVLGNEQDGNRLSTRLKIQIVRS